MAVDSPLGLGTGQSGSSASWWSREGSPHPRACSCMRPPAQPNPTPPPPPTCMTKEVTVGRMIACGCSSWSAQCSATPCTKQPDTNLCTSYHMAFSFLPPPPSPTDLPRHLPGAPPTKGSVDVDRGPRRTPLPASSGHGRVHTQARWGVAHRTTPWASGHTTTDREDTPGRHLPGGPTVRPDENKLSTSRTHRPTHTRRGETHHPTPPPLPRPERWIHWRRPV